MCAQRVALSAEIVNLSLMKMMKDYCLAMMRPQPDASLWPELPVAQPIYHHPCCPPAHHRRTRNRRAATVIRNLEARYSQIINFRTAAIQTLVTLIVSRLDINQANGRLLVTLTVLRLDINQANGGFGVSLWLHVCAPVCDSYPV